MSILRRLRPVLILAALLPAFARPKITTTGTPASAPPTLYGPGWNIGGGGTDVDAAMQWLVNYVRGGAGSSNKIDIVILRTSGSSGYNAPWSILAGVSSVTTIVGTSRADFDDPAAAGLVRNAGVVFFAGGDQATYVQSIKDSACDTAARYVMSRGGGMGGTSAGTAIQGPIIFDSIAADAAGGANVASADALADPYESTISFTRNWYAWPHFDSILCEPHFGDPADDASNKDRMGRLMAFLARQVKDGVTASAWGMAVNAGTSLVVDRNGLGTVMSTGTPGDGIVYMVLLDRMPEVCQPGAPLTCSGYKIWRLTAGQTFNLASRPACSYYVGGVSGGQLTGNFYTPGTLVTACDTAPVITAQPASQTVDAGQAATFSVVATGTSLLYQWQRNGAAIPGAASASYTTPATTASDNGAQYRAVVSNAAGSATSASATLTVNGGSGAPAITTQPASQTVAAGQTATFSVVASGSGLAYQWMRNGAALAGANAASYTTPPATSADNGAGFSVTVTNASGGATSNTAILTVASPGGTFTEAEPNSSISQANNVSALAFPLTLSGTCSSSSDIDYFKLTLAPGQTLVASLAVPSTADMDLKLKSASGSQLASSTNNGKGVNESFSYKNTGSTTLTVYPEVLGYSGSGSYTLMLQKQ